ncbi:phosphate-starvation-inducible PsiE family protein [Microvirga arsenatis]|nr:phosphate-starvation-inducible PsiE family protein [Microvirga arsenatis]
MIAVALVNVAFRILMLMLFGLLDPAETGVFQVVFDMISTVLIALEFNHSTIGVLHRKECILQVRTVVLIALLALVRKFIILDATKHRAVHHHWVGQGDPGARLSALAGARPRPEGCRRTEAGTGRSGVAGNFRSAAARHQVTTPDTPTVRLPEREARTPKLRRRLCSPP